MARQIQRIYWSLRYRGLAMTALSCLANIFRFRDRSWYWRLKERRFDRRHGIDTGGLIPVEALDVGADDRLRGWGYMATQPEWFHRTLSELRLPWDEYAFVDFGSGKGRSLLLAAARPFERIVGVEFSRQLHEVALQNVAVWRDRHRDVPRLECICTDATRFPLPMAPAVLYFYNPFKTEVMREVLANIEASWRRHPRHLVLIYANPTCRELMDQADFLSLGRYDTGAPDVAVYQTEPDARETLGTPPPTPQQPLIVSVDDPLSNASISTMS